jgi:hypothetical protein
MNKNRADQPYIQSLLISIFFVGLVIVTNYFLLRESDHKGVIGDMFGISNAIFSGLAICGLMYTLSSQKESISIHGQSLQIANIQSQFSIQAFRLQALTAALQSIDQQIILTNKIQNPNERIQKAVPLEKSKSEIEIEIKLIIDNIIKNKGA